MASSMGEGTSYEGGGGTGGKFRKRPFRKPPQTPYLRPPTALRNSSTEAGWFSRIIRPASKLITSSAQLFFPSLLRKRIAPPSQSQPATGRESKEIVQEAVQNNPSRVQQSAVDEHKSPSVSFDGSGISELEQVLRQRSFTRSEINHLLDLLNSKTVGLHNKDGDRKGAGTSLAHLASPSGTLDKFAGSLDTTRRGSYLESQKCAGWISSPVMSSQIPKKNVSSPAELAKAYMGNKTSEVPPSMLSLHYKAHMEDTTLHNNVPFPPESPSTSLVKPTTRALVPANGFITPRSLGRSAIYNMARTPYTKVHPTSSQKDLKRRSSVIDDEVESIGPIRRLRQKTNLITNSLNHTVARSPLAGGTPGVVSVAAKDPSLTTKAVLSIDGSGHKIPVTAGKTVENGIRGTNYTSIPSKSTDVAAKILEQLEKLVPNEQSSQVKPVMKGKSPHWLTTAMLQGQALRSLENVDSLQILQGFQDPQIGKEMHGSFSVTCNDASSRKQMKVEENGQVELNVSCEKEVPSEKNTSIKDISPFVENAVPNITESVLQPYSRRAFQMSALEDESWDIDDDIDFNEVGCIPVIEGNGNLETPVEESKSLHTDVVPIAKSPSLSSESKSLFSSVTPKTTVFGSLPAFAGELPPPVTTSQLASAVLPLNMEPKQLDAAPPVFSFSTIVEKAPLPPFSTLSPATRTSDPKPSSPDSKVASTNGFPIFSSGPTTRSQISVSDKGGIIDSKATAESTSKAVTSFLVPVPTSTTGNSNISSGFVTDKSSNGDNKGEKETVVEATPKPQPPVFAAIPTSSSEAATASSVFTFVSLAKKSDLGNNKDMQVIAEEATGKLPTSTTISNIFTFGSPEIKPNISNGSVSSSPMTFSTISATSAPGSFTTPNFQSADTPNGTITAITSSSNLSSPFSSLPLITSGDTSVAPPSNLTSSMSTAGTDAVSTDLKSKNEKETTTFGNLTSNIFGSSMPISASSNNSLPKTPIFGATASLPGTEPSTATTSVPIQFGASSTVFGNSLPGTEHSTPTTSMPVQFGASSTVFGNSLPGTEPSTATTSMPVQFGASSTVFGNSGINPSSSPFGFGANSTSSSSSGTNSSMFGSSPATNMFGSTTGFGTISSSSAGVNSTSSSGPTSSLFSSSWPSSSTSSIFGSTSASSSQTTSFVFGQSHSPASAASSAAAVTTIGSPMVFGSTTGSSSGSFFSFASSTATTTPQTLPAFGSSFPTAFAHSSNNGDQMNMEDSMAEDPVQSSAPSVPVFGQPSIAAPPSSGFMFGSAHPSFQFGQAALSNPPPAFQASGSVEFGGGGGSSFSLGSGADDKSNRKFVRVKHKNRRK